MTVKKETSVVVGVTASIALYKACDVIRRLKERGMQVSVVMTEEAATFIHPLVFQSLSENRVYRGLFEEPDVWEIGHISLADRADMVLVVPATANTISKVAHGICDDILTCVISATKAPVVFCPAMNENMYLNKITQSNIRILKDAGYDFIEPRTGKLACGKIGVGCLADVDTIVQETLKVLSQKVRGDVAKR